MFLNGSELGILGKFKTRFKRWRLLNKIFTYLVGYAYKSTAMFKNKKASNKARFFKLSNRFQFISSVILRLMEINNVFMVK